MKVHDPNDILPRRMTDDDVCARRPVHIPGAIQPHGALVCVSPDGLRVIGLLVLHVSDNARVMLDAGLTEKVGRSLREAYDMTVRT